MEKTTTLPKDTYLVIILRITYMSGVVIAQLHYIVRHYYSRV